MAIKNPLEYKGFLVLAHLDSNGELIWIIASPLAEGDHLNSNMFGLFSKV